VALPLARPAIAAGTALALMETLADFGTVAYFGVQTFTTGIYRAWFAMGEPTAAAQLSSALLGFVLLVLTLERLSRGRSRYHHTSARYRRLPGYTLGGGRAALAVLACALPLTIGFVVPAGVLLHMALTEGDAQFGAKFVALAFNSLILAAVTAVAAVAVALVMAYGGRLHPHPLARVAGRVAGMGYAVPGSVIAVGTLLPFGVIDNAVDAWMRSQFGVSTGLVLTGSIAALVFAYLVRFLAVSLNTIEASLAKIRPSMDDAARALGRGPTETVLKIHVPLMSGGLLTAALIVFVDVMKELPATLIMRPFDFDTLAVQAYNLASDERLSEASTAALAIVAVGILPVVVLSRAIARSRPGA
jgi:iron(III) transport system permease protein